MEDSIIRIMLKDEYDRTLNMLNAYKDELLKFPKGNIFIREEKNNSYMYLKLRENGKVKSEYIGNINSKRAIDVRETIIERNYIKENIKRLEFEKREIEVYLKAGDKLYGYKKRRGI